MSLQDSGVLPRVSGPRVVCGIQRDGLAAMRAISGTDADARRHGLPAARAGARLDHGLVRRCCTWSEAHNKPPIFPPGPRARLSTADPPVGPKPFSLATVLYARVFVSSQLFSQARLQASQKRGRKHAGTVWGKQRIIRISPIPAKRETREARWEPCASDPAR